MNEAQFWTLIEKASKLGKRDEDETCEALFEALTKMKIKDLAAFDSHMHQALARAHTWKLWGAAYLLQGGCSDDGFLHFRLWAVSQGKAAFEAILANPDKSLSAMEFEEPDMETTMEGLLYVVADAFDEIAGDNDELPDVELPEDPAGERFDFEDEQVMAAAYPKLWDAYGPDSQGEDEDEDDGDETEFDDADEDEGDDEDEDGGDDAESGEDDDDGESNPTSPH